jgi:hypothetical protein
MATALSYLIDVDAGDANADATPTPLTREEVIRKWKEAYEREALCNILDDVAYFT